VKWGMAAIAAGLLLTLAGLTSATGTQTEPQPCRSESSPPTPQDLHAVRVAKARYLWQRMAPWSAKPEIIEHFIREHERLGIGPEWPYSFCYGFANFGLTVGKRVGPCYGPMDVRREWARACGFAPNDLRDPKVNITCHVREMALYHGQTGETGMALLARVFYPARPMYYHRWRPTWAKLRAVLAGGYRDGEVR